MMPGYWSGGWLVRISGDQIIDQLMGIQYSVEPVGLAFTPCDVVLSDLGEEASRQLKVAHLHVTAGQGKICAEKKKYLIRERERH